MYDIFGSLNKVVYFLNFIKNMGHIDHFTHACKYCFLCIHVVLKLY
jgi:hypothetical protein